MCVQAKMVEQTELGQVGFQSRMEWRWILERGHPLVMAGGRADRAVVPDPPPQWGPVL